jgi:glyoxylase-like metal-dependent hydrolase (beta-lactamase superfamily II)
MRKTHRGITDVLLTHGHNDYPGGGLAILKKTDAMLVANFEISNVKTQEKILPGA